MGDLDSDLKEFDGTVRLFPLQNFVMLPHVVKPFHIFEPRYREMTEDSLISDRFITMVLQKEENDPVPGLGTPPIAKMACLTRIVNEQRQEDGRFNLLLRGVCRVRLLREITAPTSYRQAEAEIHQDDDREAMPELRDALADASRLWLPPQGPAQSQFFELLQSKLPLGALCDIVGFALPLPSEFKQLLLDETDIDTRAQKLIHTLITIKPPLLQVETPRMRHRKYPPEFSSN